MYGYKCDYKDCKKDAEFECSFSKILQCDNSGFECSGEEDYTQKFCLEHFESFDGCGNLEKYHKLDNPKWYSDIDDYSISYYLENILKIK